MKQIRDYWIYLDDYHRLWKLERSQYREYPLKFMLLEENCSDEEFKSYSNEYPPGLD